MNQNPVSDRTALLRSATDAAKRGELDAAIVQLKSLLDLDPKNEVALGMLAAIYAQIGLRDKAAEYFQRTLQVNPRNSLARFQLGLMQLADQKPEEALETWKLSLADPGEFMAHFHSGLALLALKRPGEARGLFEQAARHMPADHPLRGQLQQLLAQQQN